MDNSFTKIVAVAARVKTPLTLAGLTVAVLYGVYRLVLALPVFEPLGAERTFMILRSVLGYIFWLAIAAIVLGIGAHILIAREGMRNRTSRVTLVDASLDPKDSDYEQTKDGAIRHKRAPRAKKEPK